MGEDESSGSDRRSDFDFLVGRWAVHHRQLKGRLVGSTEWIEHRGSCTAWKLMEGLANVDDHAIRPPAGPYRAASVRVFDPRGKFWSIWWFDSRSPTHLDPPLVGRFDRGVGTFFAEDSLSGRAIKVRFIWSQTGTPSPRWEQAFSADGGVSWEVNWTMEFEREGEA